MTRPSEKRRAARRLVEHHGLAVSRACRCVALSRSAYYREPPDWRDRDGALVAALEALIEHRPDTRVPEVLQAARAPGTPL